MIANACPAPPLPVQGLSPALFEPAREVLESLWESYRFENDLPDCDRPSTNMCVLTSLALLRHLQQNGYSGWYVDGGSPETGSGFRPSDGEDLEWHVWITDGEVIVDLTADQFSDRIPSVLITAAGDRRYATTVASRIELPDLLKLEPDGQEAVDDWAIAINECLAPQVAPVEDISPVA
ncbi:hypothetical protein AA14337_2889 [Acetobacter malorum DSM 14337]|uniref:Uncharacterized protein n=1 Tax=Acetobacter malorum DSM 14337 TaxID=1307910 RepID=A0ABQ0PYE9_9PROT|nr:hypothetical protein [Acetobacter malorum]KXV06806.1 hypothetical protein AD930_06825 [Acetobacter malorum]GBQ84691.1 hypothetical protein AA14337_2889 [Acetobacter malorum DSM 14337]